MSHPTVSEEFVNSASEWICDSYSLDIRYLAKKHDGKLQILDASLVASPLAKNKPTSFSIEFGSLIAGQEFTASLSKTEILRKLSLAVDGDLVANGLRLSLPNSTPLDHYSEMPRRDSWLFDLHLQTSGGRTPPPSPAEALRHDQTLRRITPPFDGMADLCSWLQLSDTRISGQSSTINVRVHPPVVISLEESTLLSNRLKLTLSAHSKFPLSNIHLATREFPGSSIETRKQVSESISWRRAKDGLRTGFLEIPLINADSVLAMLMAGDRTVMRRWFLDPGKAVNSRYVATQHFDKDLSRLRKSLIDTTDSVGFEKGVASLLFLLGFSPAIQVESEAPDIVVTTPGGKLAIVECTIKTSDFENKVGKLVDRRNALRKVLEASNHNSRVDAFLVCGLPKSQISAEESRLAKHQVLLLSREDITQAFEQLRMPSNSDEMLERAVAKLSEHIPLD